MQAALDDTISENGQLLIFVNSRKSSQKEARELSKHVLNRVKNEPNFDNGDRFVKLNNIAETQVHIANIRGKVGARLNLLERQMETLTQRDIAIQKDIGNLADADLAELVTEMQSMMTSLQASQQAFVKISNLNLFEFIR